MAWFITTASSVSAIQLAAIAGCAFSVIAATMSDLVRSLPSRAHTGQTYAACAQIAEIANDGLFHCGNWGELRCRLVATPPCFYWN